MSVPIHLFSHMRRSVHECSLKHSCWRLSTSEARPISSVRTLSSLCSFQRDTNSTSYSLAQGALCMRNSFHATGRSAVRVPSVLHAGRAFKLPQRFVLNTRAMWGVQCDLLRSRATHIPAFAHNRTFVRQSIEAASPER